MSGETLYAIACEMLQTTNVFNKDVMKIKYTNSQREVVSLLKLVKLETSTYNHRLRGKTERNIQYAFESIVLAMSTYLEGYPAPFSFKQKTKAKFKLWLDRIGDAFSVPDPKAHNMTVSKNTIHTGVAMLKLLHSREGVTIEELAKTLEISSRAIQKDLVKLSPSLYTGEKEPYVQFRLGGQPLQAEITAHDNTMPKRFYTRNSVHPLVLQQNIMQLATLLKSLCHQFCDYEDDFALRIAIDIWNQMSDYAQEKIKNHYAYDNKNLTFFIDLLENDCPDDHVCPYYTEREMLDMIESPLPIDQALPALTKEKGRTGIIHLNCGKRILAKSLFHATLNDGTIAYKAIDAEGNTVIFTKDQVENIELTWQYNKSTRPRT